MNACNCLGNSDYSGHLDGCAGHPESEWTPTTEIVREAFSNDPEVEYHDPITYPDFVRQNRRMFNRWLDSVRREAKAEALLRATEAKRLGGHPLFDWDQCQWLREHAANLTEKENI